MAAETTQRAATAALCSPQTPSLGSGTWTTGARTFWPCPEVAACMSGSPPWNTQSLMTNGDFGSSSGWTAGTGWSIGAGVATATAGTASSLYRVVPIEAGKTYEVTFIRYPDGRASGGQFLAMLAYLLGNTASAAVFTTCGHIHPDSLRPLALMQLALPFTKTPPLLARLTMYLSSSSAGPTALTRRPSAMTPCLWIRHVLSC